MPRGVERFFNGEGRTFCPKTQKVNNIFMRAIRESGSNAELIANLWGWSPFMEWTEAQTQRGVELLDKDISVMCVSEYDLAIEKGGVESKIIDYSISNPGPSEITKNALKKAVERVENVSGLSESTAREQND